MENMENPQVPKMRRDSFIFYTSWLEGIDAYSYQEQAEIIFALARYCAYGIEPDLSVPHVKMAYLFNKPSIDKNYRKYLNRVGKTKEEQNNNKTTTKEEQNNNKTTTKEEQNNIKQEQNGKSEAQRLGVDDDVDDDVDVGNKKERKKKESFAPPSVEDVRAYMQEYIKEKAEEGRYLTMDDDDPDIFINTHSSGDWILKNGKKMKDWRGAVRTWVLKHNKWYPNHLEERKHTLLQDDTDFGRFNRWLLREVPYVAGHFDTLLAEPQFQALKRAYGTERLTDILYDLENRHDWCDKCSDLNTTLINWLTKDNGKQ